MKDYTVDRHKGDRMDDRQEVPSVLHPVQLLQGRRGVQIRMMKTFDKGA